MNYVYILITYFSNIYISKSKIKDHSYDNVYQNNFENIILKNILYINSDNESDNSEISRKSQDSNSIQEDQEAGWHGNPSEHNYSRRSKDSSEHNSPSHQSYAKSHGNITPNNSTNSQDSQRDHNQNDHSDTGYHGNESQEDQDNYSSDNSNESRHVHYNSDSDSSEASPFIGNDSSRRSSYSEEDSSGRNAHQDMNHSSNEAEINEDNRNRHNEEQRKEEEINQKKKENQYENYEVKQSCDNEFFVIPDLFSKFNKIGENINKNIFSGYCNEQSLSFVGVKPNSRLSSIKVYYSDETIQQLSMMFVGDNSYQYGYGDGSNSKYVKEHKFRPDETLKNYMLIAPLPNNKYVSIIYFETNYGVKFQAGNLYISDYRPYLYYVEGKFLAGFFGYSDSYISGLGIILQDRQSCNYMFNTNYEYYYSRIAKNSKGELLTGYCGQNQFTSQKENEYIQKITVYYSEERINGISLIFTNDNEKPNNIGDIGAKSPNNISFEFEPSEYIIKMRIAEVTDPEHPGVAFLEFETSYGSSFSAGVSDDATKVNALELDISRNFLAGFFGYVDNNILVGLGVIVYRDIIKEDLKDFHYSIPDDMREQVFTNAVQQHTYTSLKYCNETVDEAKAIGKIEKMQGIRRVFDGPILFKAVELKRAVTVPKVSFDIIHGEFNYKIDFEEVDWTRVSLDTLANEVQDVEVDLIPCQCVTLEYKWNIFKLDHVKVSANDTFSIRVNQMIQDAENPDEYIKAEFTEITKEVQGDLHYEEVFYQSINYVWDKVRCYKYSSKIGLKKQPACCKVKRIVI